MIHIHNGDVVAVLARRAEIPGEHVPFRESLVSGPLTPGPHWIESRARFLAAAFGEDVLRTSNDLFVQEQALDAAAEKPEEIVLWFEHDLFCLVHLLCLLQRFGERKLSLVWHPTPLGHLEERELALLFESRAAVTPAMLGAAREAWSAITHKQPTKLNRFLERDHADFPFLQRGLLLHASRFPSTSNGLGAIEQRALARIASGVSDFLTLFPLLDDALDGPGEPPPRFGFGDSQVLHELRGLARRGVPLITLKESDEPAPPPKATFAITPAGENVLRGEVDDAKINDRDLWLGGVHVTKENLWRFDAERQRIVQNHQPGS